MIPDLVKQQWTGASAPRVSGDDPASDEFTAITEECSPRVCSVKF